MRRTVELPEGETLVVRAMERTDLEALDHLYDQLSTSDLHRRFFSAARPPRAFFERWFERTRADGCGLVAEVSGPTGRFLVGDAGYVMLPDGSGELAMTVRPGWRGWLGHYLLDALVQEAAERGVTCLQADVLLENRQMLSLLDARGYATVDHPDWNTVRVMIGTSGRVADWPGFHDRPRVLVEVPGGRWYAEAAAQEAGYQVASCPGPRRGPGGRCPLLRNERCPLADGADVIVVGLPLDANGGAVIDAHRAQNPATPLCLSSARSDDLAAGADRVDAVVPVDRDLAPLLAVLERLMGGAGLVP